MIVEPENIPQQTHFAALVFKSRTIQHEGDERSRTHPGHGYPAYSETIHTVEYIPFPSKKEMEKWVLRAETTKFNPPKYKLIEARPLTPKVSATVEIQ
jgi:hypothetical protein